MQTLEIDKAGYKGSNAEKAWNTPSHYGLRIHRKDRSFHIPKLQAKKHGENFLFCTFWKTMKWIWAKFKTFSKN